MQKYIYIGCGSFIGAVLRYLIKGIQIYNYHENVPLNTLFINVIGAFVMAFILTAAFEVWPTFNPDIRLGTTTGLLGAFTTFSTLCKETVALIQNGDYFSAVSYVTVSTMLGFGFAYFGIVAARKIGFKKNLKKPSSNTDIILNESDVN